MTSQVLTPLEGDEGSIPNVASEKPPSNAKRMAAIGGGLVLALAVIGFGVAHFLRGSSPVIVEKQSAAQGMSTSRSTTLKMPTPASAPALGSAPASAATFEAASPGPSGTAVPAIGAYHGDAKPIPLRATGAAPGQAPGNGYGTPPQHRSVDPDDAPIFAGGSANAAANSGANDGSGLASSYRSGPQGTDPAGEATAGLNALKGQLGGLMTTLQRRMSTTGASAEAPALSIPVRGEAAAALKSNLFGSMEQSATPRVSARMLGNRSMIVAKGALFLCSLKTRVVSANSGFIGCQTERNVLSDDGKVLLLERGSHLDGEYRVVTIKPGVTRVPVLWTRIRTSKGVVVDLDSPATGQLGESGLDGYVDNRWGERLGAAILLSLIEDAIQYATTPSNSTASTNVVLPNTSTQGSKLAEKVLETTINIPPLLYQNQGGVVGVYVARDIDFSSVYELRAK